MNRQPATAAVGGALPGRILAIRFGSLGDLLLTFPTLTLIKQRYPAARLDVLTRRAYAELVAAHPAVDRVELLDGRGWRAALTLARRLRRRQYELVFDLHGTPRSRLVAALSGAPARRRVGGARLARRRQVLAARWRRGRDLPRPAVQRSVEHVGLRSARLVEPALTPAELAKLMPSLRFADQTGAPAAAVDDLPRLRVALCPGARHLTKRWPDRAYAALAEALLARDIGIIVALGPGDAAPALVELAVRRPERVRIVRGSLPVLAASIATAAAAVGNDSGLAHLAVAVDVPAVVIFGATVPELGFAPIGRHLIAERRQLGCRPCAVHGGARCPRGDLACLAALDVAAVIATLDSLLSDGGGSARVVRQTMN